MTRSMVEDKETINTETFLILDSDAYLTGELDRLAGLLVQQVGRLAVVRPVVPAGQASDCQLMRVPHLQRSA